MKKKIGSWLTVGLIAAIGFGVALHQWRGTREREAMLAEIERHRIAAHAERQRWEQRAAAAERSGRTLQAALTSVSSAKNAAPSPRANAEPAPSYAERIQKDPVFQLLHLKSDRAHLLTLYAALFQKLGLSAEQIDRFQAIVARRKERELDLDSVMKTEHLPEDDPLINKLKQEGDDEFTAASRALLGEAGYSAVLDYERTAWVRDMVAGWAGGAVVAIREPFTSQQGEALVQLMANASTAYRHGGAVEMDEPGYWPAVEAEAEKILSPAQFQLFRTMEPPLPNGARYQAQFYAQVLEALKADKTPAAETKPPSG